MGSTTARDYGSQGVGIDSMSDSFSDSISFGSALFALITFLTADFFGGFVPFSDFSPVGFGLQESFFADYKSFIDGLFCTRASIIAPPAPNAGSSSDAGVSAAIAEYAIISESVVSSPYDLW